MLWNWNKKKQTDRFGSWLPSWAHVASEGTTHPHVPAERAELFNAHNAGTTELEVLNWLHATVMLLKPEHVLETGAANGLGTIALASACKNNGFGKVHSVEIDPGSCYELASKLRDANLAEYVEIHCDDSREYLKKNTTVFDLGFYDSMCELRADEFRICLEKQTIRKLAVFHDTSPLRCQSLKDQPIEELHSMYRNELKEFAADPRCSGSYESLLSRGFVCLFIKPV